MKLGLFGYLRAAFNARPFGMFVPPNWVGLAAFGLLGLLNPGFWLIGLAVEFGYLAALATNSRFQRTIDGRQLSATQANWQQKQDALIAKLTDGDQARYVALVARCRAVLEQQAQHGDAAGGLATQSESLGRLSWMYLRLLLARRAMARVLKDGTDPNVDSLDDRIAELKRRLTDKTLPEELRKSLEGQLEILNQRLTQRTEGREKLTFLDAELTRIQEQVELLREQAALSTDAEGVSAKIDAITSTLGGTAQWITDQQRTFGAMEDLLEDPPPLPLAPRARQSQ